jgi:hypothetical protein
LIKNTLLGNKSFQENAVSQGVMTSGLPLHSLPWKKSDKVDKKVQGGGRNETLETEKAPEK